MKSLREAVRNVLMRERSLQSFEKEFTGNGSFTFDVFLHKDKEYIVRTRTAKGAVPAKFSLKESNGSSVPVHMGDNGTYFSAVPERDGFYRIETIVEGAGKGKAAVLKVSLYTTCALPPYVMHQSVLPAYVGSYEEVEMTAPGKAATVRMGMEAFGRTHA
ncbi:MAG TPA: hypothetical protein VGJ94_10120 [Syntrophorhabdaceae bacterium]|jgi:hypothetical protein